jgi:hypothetical protein
MISIGSHPLPPFANIFKRDDPNETFIWLIELEASIISLPIEILLDSILLFFFVFFALALAKSFRIRIILLLL